MFHRSFQQAILTEPQDCIIFYYLQTFRNLSVENMGAAKEHLKCMMQLIKNHKFHSHIGWDFSDMKSGSPYQKLTGEHKVVADNLIRYLTRQMTPVERTEFENENYLLTPPNDQNPLS